MSWGVSLDGRMDLYFLFDPLLESSSLNPLEYFLLDPLLGPSLLDPFWCLLYSILFGFSFAQPCIRVF